MPLVAVGATLGVLATTGFAAVSTSTVAAAAAAAPAALSAVASTATPLTGGETLREITTDAETTLQDARLALVDADAVSAEITGSGLDLGAESTAVPTSDLRGAIERLADLDVLPLLLLPNVEDEVSTETRVVADRVAALQERLDAARAQKAAEEAAAAAAAAAAAEAQRQAEAAAAAAAALAAANTPEGAKATAQQLASANYGWGGNQFSCLASLWEKESNWNYQAYNASSGATGIPQALPGSKMASAGSDWQTNAATQVAWGLDYISRAYGTPCAAWGHSQATNWY
ncbi:outer membrane phospholipase A [Microbacterium yannicii]|uniref:aggregation-promoting factor C-terminal-like domain-containing protein n=1 Tax=Microbacterium yannicii TaxID=671622 RepID=UPI0005901A30|nr:outer membrane phospholipase A [Microbacterium yannicii]